MCVRLRWVSGTRMSISYHIISHHITSHHIIHIISHLIASHRITSITSHHITSHHIISAIMTYHISYHIKYRIIYRIIFFIVVFRFRSINPYFMARTSLYFQLLFSHEVYPVSKFIHFTDFVSCSMMNLHQQSQLWPLLLTWFNFNPSMDM